MLPALAAPVRAVLATALAAAFLAASALVTPPAGGVTVSQSYAMPVQGTVTFVGHGFGHGHGMSQYGAEGAARKGLTWQQITQFYYPGTTVAKSNPWVRVKISADTTRDVVVKPRTGLQVRNLRTGELWALPQVAAQFWRLDVSGTSTTVDWFNGTWNRWKAFTGDGGFSAGAEPVALYVGNGVWRNYRGTLVAAAPSAGSTDRDTVNLLLMDYYLRGVVPKEMPASWSPMAVRAQAVAARTYASYELNHPRAGHYQLCDTTSCQVYGGYDAEHALATDAIAATAQSILLYAGAPAFTQFGSSSGGWTSPNQFAYLPAKQDPYDNWAGNPVHNWTKTVDVVTIEKAWPALGDLKAVRFLTRDGRGDWSGRVWTMELTGLKAGVATRVSVSGDTFRSKLALRSTYFTVGSTLARS